MQHLTKILDYSFITINTFLGLSQIESILGIIILSFQIILIIAKCFNKIKEHIKNKNIDGAIQEGEKLVDELNDIKENINNGSGKHS